MKLVHTKIEYLVYCLYLSMEYMLHERWDYFVCYVHYWNLSIQNNFWKVVVFNKYLSNN